MLEQLGVTDVICGAVSRLLFQKIEMRGIRVIPFVSGEIEKVLLVLATG
jgi:predicted Fe-Mo cluster-binding NifX family protein